MTKRPVAPGGKSVRTTGHRQAPENAPTTASAVPASRIDRLVGLADHCAAARALAEGLDEAFLVHLLAMVIQEANTIMRQAGSAPL